METTKLVISKTFLILFRSFSPLVAMKMMKIVYIQFRDIPPLYEATGTPCVYRYFRVIRALSFCRLILFLISVPSRYIITGCGLPFKRKSVTVCQTYVIGYHDWRKPNKCVEMFQVSFSFERDSSFYESPLTKELSRSRNNREWTSKGFGEIVLFSNPFFRFGFNYSRNLGNI